MGSGLGDWREGVYGLIFFFSSTKCRFDPQKTLFFMGAYCVEGIAGIQMPAHPLCPGPHPPRPSQISSPDVNQHHEVAP